MPWLLLEELMLAAAQQPLRAILCPSSHFIILACPQSHCTLEVNGTCHSRLALVRPRTSPVDGSGEGVTEDMTRGLKQKKRIVVSSKTQRDETAKPPQGAAGLRAKNGEKREEGQLGRTCSLHGLKCCGYQPVSQRLLTWGL